MTINDRVEFGNAAGDVAREGLSRQFSLGTLKAMSSRRAWRLWLLVACLTSICHLVTLRISPPIWQDEVEIVELGRNVFPDSDHSWSTLWTSKGSPLRIVNYVGPCLQELACRLAGGSEIGPRLSTLLGTLLAGTCLLGWLLSRGCRPFVALVSASLLLLDPVFAQSWFGARVDCWAFAFIFMTCWLVWRGSTQHARPSRLKPSLAAAGVCLSLAGFCWASAILLVPLVAHEVLVAFRPFFKRERIAEIVPDLVTLAGGTAVTSLLLLLPIWRSVGNSIGSTGAAVSSAAQHTSLLSTGMMTITKSLSLSPWVFAFGLLAMFLAVNRALLVAFLGAALAVCVTNPYTGRVFYLLPYLILSLANLFDRGLQGQQKRAVYARIVLVAMWLFVCWSAAITLGARTLNAWRQRQVRSPDRIMEVAVATVGPRAATVYTPCHEFYYAGRQLGWRVFRIFDYGGPGAYYGISPAFLARMEFVILRAGEENDAQLQDGLRQAGLVLTQRIRAGDQAGTRPGTSGSDRMGVAGFGEYLFFAREPSAPEVRPKLETVK